MADADTRTQTNKADTIGWKIIIGALIAVFGALVGWGVNFAQQLRSDRLTFVSAQIEKLYGPLFSYSQANRIAWGHFRETHWPERKAFFQPNDILRPQDIELWRRYMTQVFQPMNVQMELALTNNSHLLVGRRMPVLFLQFISHVEAYKAVMARWINDPLPTSNIRVDQGLIQQNVSPVYFPQSDEPGKPDFDSCIIQTYSILRDRQDALRITLWAAFESDPNTLPESCGPSGYVTSDLKIEK